MVSKLEIRFAVGILGNVISLLLFISPVPTFVKIYKKKSVEQYSPVPYIATLGNCALWVLYGLPDVTPDSIPVISINGAGFIIQLTYLLIFITYSDKRKRLRFVAVILSELLLVVALAVLVFKFAHRQKLRSEIVGDICIAANICMYAAPLSVMRLVVSTKSVEYMPLSISLASLANSICWTIYACIKFDPHIVAPNGLGALFCMIQLVLYAMYYKSSKNQKLETKNAEMTSVSVSGGGGLKDGDISDSKSNLPV